MKRTEIKERLAKAMAAAENPAAVLCIEPFASVDRDGGERLGQLLARVIRDPDRAFIAATPNAFVFTFDDQIGRAARRPDSEIPGTTNTAQQT